MDQQAPISFIINSLAAGEISPSLFGRTDLAKYHQAAMTMRNFFVDYKGGASSRPGTQYMGAPGSMGYARLWPFKFSAAIGQTYMLVFSNLKLRIIKNPGGNTYPNSSNAGFILSGGVPYEVATPYLEADLRYLKFSQTGDILTITRHGYVRMQLSRITDTNWTFTAVSDAAPLSKPVITLSTISPAPSPTTDPQNTRYFYRVSAVDANGKESLPSLPWVTQPGINIAVTAGSVSLFWSPIAGAVFYKVYKGVPAPGGKVPTWASESGFAGFTYGTTFVDSNVVPDFTKGPPTNGDPFAPGQILSYTITSSSADWPIQSTSIAIAGGGGAGGGFILPIFSTTDAGANGSITGLYIENPGSYATTPTISASGGGTTFTATVAIGPQTGLEPDVCGLFQQRQIYASSNNFPSRINGSRPGQLNDFRVANPTVDSDAYSFDIAAAQVTNILWLQPMPGGLVVGTDSGILQLTGGSSGASNPSAVTPANAVFVPQSYFGTADLHPIVIDYDILYVQSEGALVRDLQYNFFVNIYTGTDISFLSSHLFYPLTITDWAYQDVPNKVVWAVRSDGALLSLTYLKAQEVLGWARHDTANGGIYESVACVQEGAEDAIYVSVNRGGTRTIERLCSRNYYMVDDAWCLDAALSTPSVYPAANITVSGSSGTVTIVADAAVFAGGDVGKVIRATSSKLTITAFTNATHVTGLVTPGYEFGALTLTNGGWRMDPVASTVSGLAHLNGQSVYALADGLVQGPFTVSGGSVTLTTPASQVVVGLPYTCQLQPIYFDAGGEANTLQGKRKKVAAVSVRVRDAARVKYGPDFSHLKDFVQGLSSTDPVEELPNRRPGLDVGDQRIIINAVFNRIGSIVIQQDYPLPVSVLAIIPEIAQGDTR